MSETTIQNEAPSKTFADLLCQNHATHAGCDYCGRTHYADPNPDSSCASDETLAFRIQESQNPDKFHRHLRCDGVAFGEIDGRNFVYGCPCNAVARHETFIWKNRQLILDYLEQRAGDLFGHAMGLKAGVTKARQKGAGDS